MHWFSILWRHLRVLFAVDLGKVTQSFDARYFFSVLHQALVYTYSISSHAKLITLMTFIRPTSTRSHLKSENPIFWYLQAMQPLESKNIRPFCKKCVNLIGKKCPFFAYPSEGLPIFNWWKRCPCKTTLSRGKSTSRPMPRFSWKDFTKRYGKSIYLWKVQPFELQDQMEMPFTGSFFLLGELVFEITTQCQKRRVFPLLHLKIVCRIISFIIRI